jgi:hypothetical protein
VWPGPYTVAITEVTAIFGSLFYENTSKKENPNSGLTATIYDQPSTIQINYQTSRSAKTAQQSMIQDVAKQSNGIICATQLEV